MMAVTITWSAVIEPSDAACVVRRTTQILSRATPDPQDAAAIALKWWLEDSQEYSLHTNWDEELGEDETEARAHVVIHEPADMAGVFEVQLERTIVARGYHTDDGDAEKYAAIVNCTQRTEAA